MTKMTTSTGIGTAIRCYYATDPKTRPACQLTATLRIGTIALSVLRRTTLHPRQRAGATSATHPHRSTRRTGVGQPSRRGPTRRTTHARHLGAPRASTPAHLDRDRRPARHHPTSSTTTLQKGPHDLTPPKGGDFYLATSGDHELAIDSDRLGWACDCLSRSADR
jgi:hypothetical protein